MFDLEFLPMLPVSMALMAFRMSKQILYRFGAIHSGRRIPAGRADREI
jgi:hypothetical protein